MNSGERGNIKHAVMRSIDESKPHSVFFISDYTALGAAETIRKILQEATLSGLLEKAGHGIYVKPKVSRFGHVPVPLEKIAREIADREYGGKSNRTVNTGAYEFIIYYDRINSNDKDR